MKHFFHLLTHSIDILAKKPSVITMGNITRPMLWTNLLLELKMKICFSKTS